VSEPASQDGEEAGGNQEKKRGSQQRGRAGRPGGDRYRIRVIRVEAAEKVVSATDEDDAIRKVQDELAKPYGFFGRWETKALDLEVVSAETRLGEQGNRPAASRERDPYFFR
jgi:hypothetical protein